MANSAVAAKAKARFGQFLKKSDYDNLIQHRTISSAVGYLKGTPRYRPVFADIDENTVHRGTVEELLSQHVFKNYIRVKKFGTGKKNGILDFYIKKNEADQIIKIITAIASKTQQNYYLNLPVYLMDYLDFDPAKAAKCKDFKELSEILGALKIYKPLIPLLKSDTPDINKCITVVDSCYIKWVFDAVNKGFKGKEKEKIKRFFLRRTDMDNILLCYRLKKFFDEDEEFIKNLVIPYYYRIKPVDIDNALKNQNPTEALISIMEKKCVPKRIAIDEEFPELGIMKADYEFFRHKLFLTNDETEAIFSLLILADNERTNLQKIIEGIRYGENPSEIEKLIII